MRGIMRNLTKEEQEAYNRSLDNLFEPTGILIWETAKEEGDVENEE